MAYKTHVGSLQSYKKGLIELDDDLRKYAFSNVFEVAGKAAPFERVAVVQSLEYVAEVGRVVARRGHQVLLPQGSAYQMCAGKPAVAIIQTADGPVTVKRWNEICTVGE